MAEIEDIVLEVRDAMSAALCSLVEEALDGACKDMRDQTSTAIDGKTLLNESDKVLARFKQQLEKNFTELVKFSSRMDLDISSTLDFGNLRLIEEDDLEAIIAMEGMIAHARNTDIEQYLCYTTRLDKLIPHTKIYTIDKYIFVNAHGVKVIEKSRMGLARELKDGTVKVISEAPLIDRAMETVIGKLRHVRAAAT